MNIIAIPIKEIES